MTTYTLEIIKRENDMIIKFENSIVANEEQRQSIVSQFGLDYNNLSEGVYTKQV